MDARQMIAKMRNDMAPAGIQWAETSISCAVDSLVEPMRLRLEAFGCEQIRNVRVQGLLIRYEVNGKLCRGIRECIGFFVDGFIKGRQSKN